MGDAMQNIFTVILSAEFIIGSLGNGFIALVNCVEWVKGRRISLVEQIITALSLSRISLLWSAATYMLSIFYPGLLTETMRKITSITWTVSSHFNIWLTTCLSIFYFFKIANFSKSIFLCLKWRVKEVISLTLLVTLVLLPLRIVVTNPHLDVWFNEYKRNLTYTSSVIDSTQLLKEVLFSNSVFAFVPFAVSLTTFLLLIFSLRRHLKRMQHSAGGSGDVSTTAHTMALQIVVAFLLLHLIVLLSFAVQMLSYELMEKKFIFLFRQVTVFAFPSGHSCVVILGNKKLRQTSLSLLRRLRCWSNNVESSAS